MPFITKMAFTAAAVLSTLSLSQSARALDVFCPTSATATWIQAANGRTNTVTGSFIRLGDTLPGPATSQLICHLTQVAFGPAVEQTVQFAPNTVVSACGAKASFAGQAGFRGLPPFGGITFKSTRISATANYNQQTGVCRLQIPLLPLELRARVSAACTPLGTTGWRCPDGVVPVD